MNIPMIYDKLPLTLFLFPSSAFSTLSLLTPILLNPYVAQLQHCSTLAPPNHGVSTTDRTRYQEIVLQLKGHSIHEGI